MDQKLVMFLLGFVAALLFALVLRQAPTPMPQPPALELTDDGITFVPMGTDRFLVTNRNSKSGHYGRFVIISVASGKVEVVAQGNWKPLLDSVQ